MYLRTPVASLLALPASLRSTLSLAGAYNLYTTVPATSILPQATVSSHQQQTSATYATMASTDDAQREGGSGQRAMLARQRAKEDPETKAQYAKSGYFPLSYKEGLSQWWAGLAPAVTEHKVLSYIPYLQKPPTHVQTGSEPPSSKSSTMSVDQDSKKEAAPVRTDAVSDPYGPRQWQSKMVQLAGKNRALNEFSVERIGEETENNLVMLHGYGAGLGFFYKNFEALSRLPHWKLYALDMLGMGRSSRPPFKINAKDRQGKIREAENWFIDALEEWRVKKGIDKMTLLGHSLGGYMAVCYALKYPGHLNKLILASPVGIPEDPYAINEAMPEPDASTMTNEFTESQDDTIVDGGPHKPQVDSANGALNPKLMQQRLKSGGDGKPPPPRRQLPKWLVTLWDANISPFSLVRLSGPLGPRLVSGWTSRRFSHLPQDEAQALHDYSYSLFRQRGSGEYVLAHVLAPGAFARSPLIRRIQGVGRQYLESHATPDVDISSTSPRPSVEKVRETGIPVVLMYGENDWMDVGGGRDAAAKLDEEKTKALSTASEAEKKRENGNAKVTIIRGAGHHIYLDNPSQFNDEIVGEMRDVETREQRLARA